MRALMFFQRGFLAMIVIALGPQFELERRRRAKWFPGLCFKHLIRSLSPRRRRKFGSCYNADGWNCDQIRIWI